jgi:hypothetical protein
VGPASVELVIKSVDTSLCAAQLSDDLFITTARRAYETPHNAPDRFPGNSNAVRSDVLDDYSHEQPKEKEDELKE